jgi:hypothetical protein
MKTVPAILLLLFLPILPLAEAAPLMPENFQYSADLKGQIKTHALYQIVLSKDVLQKCFYSNCNDLRLSDSNNNEVPYVIVTNYHHESTDSYSFEITNYESGASADIITMKLPEKHRPISVIKLNIPETDFNKQIILHGSPDSKKWILLAEDNIYDFSSQVNLRKTEIKFNTSDYRYYRIQLVEKKLKEDEKETLSLKYKDLAFNVDNIKNKKIRISGILGQTATETSAPTAKDTAVFADLAGSVDSNRNTVIIIEANLPFDRIYIDVSDLYFYRDAAIYYSDTAEKNSWRLLSDNTIYSFPLQDRNETKNYIDCSTHKQKFYKFVIKNNDNPPLSVSRIRFEWIRKSLYFIALNEDEKYTLLFNNPGLDSPHYDLPKFINQNNWFSHKYEALELTHIKKNVNYKPSLPKDKQKRVEKTFLIGIVVILVAGLSYWLYALIRKTSQQKKGNK